MNHITTRDAWAAVVKSHEAYTKPVETDVRSVMQSFNVAGRLIASAEYVAVQDQPALVTYRVFK